jgi:hypothetical protein
MSPSGGGAPRTMAPPMTTRGPGSRFPLLYQINTRLLVSETAAALGRPSTLDDLPDDLFDRAAVRGFSWIWMLGVWQTGPAGRQACLLGASMCSTSVRALAELWFALLLSARGLIPWGFARMRD